MKQPIWIINISILGLLLLLLGFVAFYKIKLPKPEPLFVAQKQMQGPVLISPKLDLASIYTNDLFDTYKKEEARAEEPTYVKPLPTPPSPISVPTPLPASPQFLDPLPLTLTGVMVFNDESKNRAIILDTKTSSELTYKVGDEIEDAQLVKIFEDRALMIRSNGQQEMLYVIEDVQSPDRTERERKDWQIIVKNRGNNTYLIDRQEFVNVVTGISQAIDLFDLSAAYKDGVSIGSKIGSIDNDSLAYALGLRQNDIVLSINDIPTKTTQNRIDIYHNLLALPEKGTVTVSIERAGKPEKLVYELGDINVLPRQQKMDGLVPTDSQTLAQDIKKQFDDNQKSEKLRLLKQKEKFAPTLQELRLREKQNMALAKHQKPRPRAP